MRDTRVCRGVGDRWGHDMARKVVIHYNMAIHLRDKTHQNKYKGYIKRGDTLATGLINSVLERNIP